VVSPTLRPRLIAVTDTTVAPRGVLEARLEVLLRAAAPGSVMVQLRDRQLPDRDRIALGHELRALTRRHRQLFAVNDRCDLAFLLDTDGLHLGEQSISPEDARKLVGSLWISRACHDPSRAEPLGADAVVLAPVLAPRKGASALGLGAIAAARGGLAGSSTLLYALGGVDAASAPACLAAGADGVAAIGAVLDGRDVLSLLDALGISARTSR
jgi:thiamine-phosphate pyrophosphorylase